MDFDSPGGPTHVRRSARLHPPAVASSPWAEPIRIAGFASVGAGAIHATAIGVHSEHSQAMWTSLTIAVFQIGWGLWAALRPGRFVASVLALGNAALVGGWLMASTSGISFIDGLEEAEAVELGPALAGVLALVAAVLALAGVLRSTPRHRLAPGTDSSPRVPSSPSS